MLVNTNGQIILFYLSIGKYYLKLNIKISFVSMMRSEGNLTSQSKDISMLPCTFQQKNRGIASNIETYVNCSNRDINHQWLNVLEEKQSKNFQ